MLDNPLLAALSEQNVTVTAKIELVRDWRRFNDRARALEPR
jgi:hypothetical protein